MPANKSRLVTERKAQKRQSQIFLILDFGGRFRRDAGFFVNKPGPEAWEKKIYYY
jgi:hypothetical protein